MTKRKIKSQHNSRKIKSREPYDRVLIVCEGKTELLYFQGLINKLKLSTANIEIINPKQNTPNSLLKKAKELYKKSNKSGNIFDKIYCIFDKDKHPKYQQTKDNIEQIKQPRHTYYAIYSEPCFEYWLLLHFKNTTKPFIDYDELSKDKDFKRYFSKYNKTDEDVFIKLQDKIDTACNNAKNNQHTNIDKLVVYLQNIKSR